MHAQIVRENPKPDYTAPMEGPRYFVQALVDILQNNGCRSNQGNIGRKIRRAAYISMALSAVPRRKRWSRALLRHVHRRCTSTRLKILSLSGRSARTQRQVAELRRLIPGGMKMDTCKLLEETADYIQCLATQVSLMGSLARSISS
ncbi:transcription factor IBH1-like [Wolffia australiana]